MKLRTRLVLGALVALAFASVAPNALAAAKLRVLHGAPDVPAATCGSTSPERRRRSSPAR